MRTKLILLGGTTAAAAALVLTMIPSATAITSAKNFTLIAPNEERASIDLGDRGRSLGDMFVFGGPLKMRGNPAITGRLDGHCISTSNPGGRDEQRRQCVITATTNDEGGHEIQLQGVGRVLAEDVDLSVTGGSGKYANARGEATLDFRNKDLVVINFRLIP